MIFNIAYKGSSGGGGTGTDEVVYLDCVDNLTWRSSYAGNPGMGYQYTDIDVPGVLADSTKQFLHLIGYHSYYGDCSEFASVYGRSDGSITVQYDFGCQHDEVELYLVMIDLT